MSFILVGVAVAAGASQVIMANQGRKGRIAEQNAARAEMEKNKAAYENIDTSNTYANLENKFEDITVNKQQANFEAQQNQQMQANIMQNMQGAAGGSGIAGLAQAMANQGQLASQKASASIGMQEAQNQKLIAGEASKNQQLESAGAQVAQQREADKRSTLLGMSQQRKGAADQAREVAKQQAIAGVGTMVSGVGAGVDAGMANIDSGGSFFKANENVGQKLKTKNMAADANLIKGAAAAYGAGTATKQAGIAQIGNIAAGLTARVDNRTADLKQKTGEAKERKRELDDKFYENQEAALLQGGALGTCLLYTSPSPRDPIGSRMPSSA